jgi:hypothetical protein
MLGRRFVCVAAAVAAFAFAGSAHAETVLKVSLHSDLKIVDPIWTTALITTHHGNMIYDTLFSLDEKLQVRPQMVDKWEVSADKLTWTFTLRDGLEWHDGKPVTGEDCVASLKRWAARDSMGQKLMSYVTELSSPDAKTIKMVLREPYGLVLDSLGKASANMSLHDAQAGRRDRSQQADHRLHRLGPVHLQEGRMEARREGRVRQEPEVQAARRAALGPRRRQGREGRPRRMDHHPRPADPGERAAERRDRHGSRSCRWTCCRCCRRTRTSRSSW